jgi:hypothetical protein
MVNYQKGKIYKLVCNTTKQIYIGSTCESTLSRRLSNHINDYKKYLIGQRRFQDCFFIIRNNNYQIILLENYSCNNCDELKSRQVFFINSIKCINKYEHEGSCCEQIKEQKNQEFIKNKYKCECGRTIQYKRLLYHLSTKFHEENLLNKIKKVELFKILEKK